MKEDTCQCRDCIRRRGDQMIELSTMIVCQNCGNKRCPKAENHLNECTGSNAVGQTVKFPAKEIGSMKDHVWVKKEVNGGPCGVDDFWECSGCGAAAGPVDYSHPDKSTPDWPPFIPGAGLTATLPPDCDASKRMIEEYQARIAAQKSQPSGTMKDPKKPLTLIPLEIATLRHSKKYLVLTCQNQCYLGYWDETRQAFDCASDFPNYFLTSKELIAVGLVFAVYEVPQTFDEPK